MTNTETDSRGMSLHEQHPAIMTDIAVMKTQMEYIRRFIEEIKNDIKSLNGHYATKEELANETKNRTEEIEAIREKIKPWESWADWFLKIVLGALAVAILSLIIIKVG